MRPGQVLCTRIVSNPTVTERILCPIGLVICALIKEFFDYTKFWDGILTVLRHLVFTAKRRLRNFVNDSFSILKFCKVKGAGLELSYVCGM